MSDDAAAGDESRRPGPHADVLREYDKERRQRQRRRFKEAHDDRAAEKQARRDARYRRRRRREPYLRAAIRVVERLPLWLATRLGEWVGAAIFRFCSVPRRRVLQHLRLAFPAKTECERAAIGRDCLRLMGRGVVSLPALRRKGVPWILDHTDVVGEEVLREALDGGKGAVAVTFHHGPIVVGGAWLGHRWGGVEVGRNARTMDTLQLLVDVREALELAIIERGNPRAIIRALRENRPVAMLSDHDVANVNGVFVPFFGLLAHTPVGPAVLSLRTGAPIVVAVNEWVGRTRYRVRFLGLLRARDDLPRDEAVH